MSWTIQGSEYEMIECGECGIRFLTPEHWVIVRRDRGDHDKRFYCPNGHVRIWRESTLDKVTRERDRLKQQQAELQDELAAATRRAEAETKRANKIKRRAEAALCPCCNRHFSQLARHMKSKHPNVTALPTKKAG